MAAARSGAKTLLIEANGSLGGTVTNGSLPAFCPFGNTDEPLIRGIGLELLEALRAETKLPAYYEDSPEKPLYNWFPVDGEALKRILDDKVLSSGCELLLHAHFVGCETEDGVIRSVTVHTPGGLETFAAKVFIDCTGDGVLSAEAGCEIQLGNEDHLVQSGTLCFKIAPFDTERFIRYAEETGEGGNLLHACARAMADGAFPAGETKVAGIAFPAPGVAVLNFGHIYGIDPLNAASLTRAEVEGRKQLPALLRFLQNYVPGAENAVIVSSGPNLGIRESRRVMGDYVLTKEDYFRRADFDDAIAYYCYPIDIHALRPGEQAGEWNELYYNRRYQPGEAYGVPYRCLTPKG
ncbi:MAG: FAD-dependent oxidoreductase, partial [Clostridia bacterium]|nr:FAD-dependent oxidoreductase [Clostridia bacterium]